MAGLGDLYTWGKGGPRLGYESESRKVILPRLVEVLQEHRVTDVACGLAHTLGEQTHSFQSKKTVSVVVITPMVWDGVLWGAGGGGGRVTPLCISPKGGGGVGGYGF